MARQLLREDLPASRTVIERLLGSSGWELRDRRMPWNGPPLFPASVGWDDIESKEFRVDGHPSWKISLALRGKRVTGLAITEYRMVDSRLWAVGWWHNPPFDPGHPESSPASAFGAMPVAPH